MWHYPNDGEHTLQVIQHVGNGRILDFRRRCAVVYT